MKKIILSLFCFFTILHADPRVDGLKSRVRGVLPYVEGWCTEEKAFSFIDLVLEVKPDVYVDIGSFAGRSVFPVASALKFLNHGVIYAVDAWDKLECIRYYDPVQDPLNLEYWSKVNLNYILSVYLTLIRKYELEDYVITLKMTSEKAVSEIDKPIDILYLDGNHSQEVSTLDVMLYLPKVRKGGYIWMNDCLWEDRQEAGELLSEACDIVKLIDDGNCILFKKR